MKKVLVVDDEPHLRQAIMDTLRYVGYTTFGAGDGVAGLRLIHEYQPDVVIMDINLPRMNGYALLAQLRAMPETADMPVIMLSGVQPELSALRGQSLVNYVAKPFALTDLISAVQSIA